MNREAGYNYLDTSYTGTSAAYLSGLGDNELSVANSEDSPGRRRQNNERYFKLVNINFCVQRKLSPGLIPKI